MEGSQMHYKRKGERAESEGKFQKAISYHSMAESYCDVQRIKNTFKKENRGLQRYLIGNPKLGLDLQDSFLGEEMVDIKEFKPYFNEIQYRN